MSPALPGTRGLFSVLQEALGRGDHRRVRLNQHVHDAAADFRALVDAVANRPTRLQELVPTAPSDIGASDACRFGMAGVWFDALDPRTAPLLWRYHFPTRISEALVTSDNPKGTLSISDLELTAVIAHKDILATARDIAERTIWIASDNRAAVAWSNKGSATSIAAYAHLLRFNALHQRRYCYVVRNHFIPGPVNVMADDASRLWHLSDDELLTHFHAAYPQVTSWQILSLTPETSAMLIGALFKRTQRCAGLLHDTPPLPPRGSSGRPFVPASASMPSDCPLVTPSLFSKSSLNDIAPASLPPAVGLSELAQWRMPYERWA